jgi:hypothetical protein
VETAPSPTDDPSPGPFSELSLIRAIWDLYDDSGTAETFDTASVGLGPIYDTLVGPERTTAALTTIASFITGLKAQAGVDATAVDGVLAHYGIGAITSEFGDGDAAMRAIYREVAAMPLSTSVTFDANAFPNQRLQNQYFVLTAPGTHVTVTSSCSWDVDLYGVQAGGLLAAAESASGNETIGFDTQPGLTYVVVVTGWGGVDPAHPVPAPGTYTATIGFTTP